MENSYLSRARELMEEIRTNRRTIHGYAELAFDLPQTVALVMKELKSYGYEPKLCGKAGVTCTVGKPGKCILLRADMDALPMYEKTGLPFLREAPYRPFGAYFSMAALRDMMAWSLSRSNFTRRSKA